MKLARRALRLFLTYVSVNPFESSPQTIFQNFARRLVLGTADSQTGFDCSGLYWAPISGDQARNIVTALTLLFDWMSEEKLLEVHPNPLSQSGRVERALAEAAYQYRRNVAFLGHGWSATLATSPQVSRGARYTSVKVPKSRSEKKPRFQDSRFEELLFEGFKVKGRHNYRDMLITLLMRGAGFRVSEPFHLFLWDVQLVRGGPAQVFIHHPRDGGVPDDPALHYKPPNRAAYLATRWQLQPRHELDGTKHAGWKGGLHTNVEGKKVLPAYWFPESCGALFGEIWPYYMQQIAGLERNHPYAFVNMHDGSSPGEMLSIKNYRKSFCNAVERIGLEVRKSAGTTPHGLRHGYGYSMAKAKVNQKTIQLCMHHASIDSQTVYTDPDHEEIVDELRKAQPRMPSLIGSSSSFEDAFAA